MTPGSEVFLLISAGLVLGAIAYSIAITFRRMLHDDGRLRLRRVLARQGMSLAAAPASDCEKALAARACVACGEKSRCDAWLASRRRAGFAVFCPNAERIGHWSRG
jgi:hypothetical protein